MTIFNDKNGQVGERWGHHFAETGEPWSHEIFRRAGQNMEHLIVSGIDPLHVVCDRGKAKGLPVYPTLLVNQGGGDSYEDTRTSDFWLEHADMQIGAKTSAVNSQANSRCL